MPIQNGVQEILLRRDLDVDCFPYLAGTVTFIQISDERITQAKTKIEKRNMLSQAGVADVILAAWPIEGDQDVFVITNPKTVLLKHFFIIKR